MGWSAADGPDKVATRGGPKRKRRISREARILQLVDEANDAEERTRKT